MSQTRWRVVIADDPNREDLFAEIWIDDEQWAEVFIENDIPIIEVYPHPENENWTFNYEVFSEIILKVNKFLDSMKKN